MNILHGANYVILTGIFKHCLANEFPSYSKANILMYKKILVTSLACKYSSACCRDTKPNRALRVNQLWEYSLSLCLLKVTIGCFVCLEFKPTFLSFYNNKKTLHLISVFDILGFLQFLSPPVNPHAPQVFLCQLHDCRECFFINSSLFLLTQIFRCENCFTCIKPFPEGETSVRKGLFAELGTKSNIKFENILRTKELKCQKYFEMSQIFSEVRSVSSVKTSFKCCNSLQNQEATMVNDHGHIASKLCPCHMYKT